ncbi:hypothetical protein BESB_001670 [Besnoitia besnoiti]|uniref:Uncharacterized protein n=1 Tax=Besnoitia besnoiti TaxID=94643 RepID=A0A2A9MIL9_BESBE|nr:hypothetical protein BESB_001670 [Besnoitia besnoiti]PFH37825.1 hypothetical protein BESB_001670 [Besnoitia besnoiti]
MMRPLAFRGPLLPLLAAASAAILTLSATAHYNPGQVRQKILSTDFARARVAASTETSPPGERCAASASPAEKSSGSAQSVKTVSLTELLTQGARQEPGTEPEKLDKRGDWERCRASSSRTTQRSLSPGFDAASPCAASAALPPPAAVAELAETSPSTAVAEPAGPDAAPAKRAAGAQKVSFLEALGQAAAAEAAALGGGVWDLSTWGAGAFVPGLANAENAAKTGEATAAASGGWFASWGGNWRETVQQFFAKVDKRIEEANGMLMHGDLYEFPL